MHTKFKRNKKY